MRKEEWIIELGNVFRAKEQRRQEPHYNNILKFMNVQVNTETEQHPYRTKYFLPS